MAFVQDIYIYCDEECGEWWVFVGVWVFYWDLNQELFILFCVQLLYKLLVGKCDIFYCLVGGLYYQFLFYWEMWGFDGSVNIDFRV